MLGENQITDIDKTEMDRILKVGYAGILHERHPFQPPDKASYNDENAYVVSLEREYLEIPKELEFGSLKDSIDPKHHQRLSEIWDALEINYLEFHGVCEHLQTKWTENVPELPLDDPDLSPDSLDSSAIKIRSELQNSVRAVIAKTEAGSELKRWQREEKALRRMVFDRTKMFMVLLRTYYEMLLETSPTSSQEEEKEYVLAQDHPLRNEIAIRNRYLILIDSTQSGISIGKAAHHRQKRGRIRKTEQKPYIIHALDVTHATVLDVIPYALEDKKAATLATLIGIVGPVHDVVEDTDLSLEDLVENYIKRLVDIYDSSVDPLIKSGFKSAKDKENDIDAKTGEVTLKRSLVKKRVLNLIKDHTLREIKQILRILSNNCKLSKDERIAMAKECLAGKAVTKAALKITAEEDQRWGLKHVKPISSFTYTVFPEEDDSDRGKTSSFLMRLNGLTKDKEVRQHSLIFKLEDRANNLLSLNSTPPLKQRKVLRTTTSRIIAWAMLDHDNVHFPLYNALPRCIDTAIEKYKELSSSNPDLIEERDQSYMETLAEWQTNVKRFEVPAKVQAVLQANRELKKAA